VIVKLTTRDDDIARSKHATLARLATRGTSTKTHAKCNADRAARNVAELGCGSITLTDADSACIRGPFSDVGVIREFVTGHHLGRRGYETRVWYGIFLPIVNHFDGLDSLNVVGDIGGGGHCSLDWKYYITNTSKHNTLKWTNIFYHFQFFKIYVNETF